MSCRWTVCRWTDSDIDPKFLNHDFVSDVMMEVSNSTKVIRNEKNKVELLQLSSFSKCWLIGAEQGRR
jgi:hypothetical protein